MVLNQMSTIQQNGHSTLSWVYPGQSWVHIMVKDQISTIQQNGHSTMSWVYLGRAGSISWSRTRYLPFNRMVTQHWVEPMPWSQTRCPHSPKKMALDAAQKNQHISCSWTRYHHSTEWSLNSRLSPHRGLEAGVPVLLREWLSMLLRKIN